MVMVEYGYINENGFLVSKILEEYTERYRDEEDGEIKERTISIEEQINILPGWKPVDLVDDTKLQCPENYSVRIIPYDDGDKICYRYEQKFNVKSVQQKISVLKNSLTSNDSNIGDYRITKCYEASLVGVDMPYDVSDLHNKRQVVREQINNLEELITREANFAPKSV